MPIADAVDEPWWQAMPTFLNCYHPYAERYLICAVVEKCRLCGEMRSVDEPHVQSRKFWPPVSKTMPRP